MEKVTLRVVGGPGAPGATPASELPRKLAHLESILAGYKSVLVAFSGGVDSTFLLAVARRVLGDRCTALTAVSPTMAQSEIADAAALAHELGARHITLESHELERANFKDNPVDRCYHCKAELLDLAVPKAQELGLGAIVLGTNLDDLGDHRPGLAAARERGAHSPMVDAGLWKADVRALSQQLGLRTWNKPQLACLSSRFPYGTEINPERLSRIDRFEDGLRALGFRQVRVRFHDSIARLEIDVTELPRAAEPEIRQALLELGRELGFKFVTLDLAGFRSGSMNG